MLHRLFSRHCAAFGCPQERGHIYKGTYEGWYCVSDEAFLTSSQVTDGRPLAPAPSAIFFKESTQRRAWIPAKGYDKQGKPCKVSVDSGHVVEWVVEENYKFKLSAFQKPLLEWLTSRDGNVLPPVRANELLAFLRVCAH